MLPVLLHSDISRRGNVDLIVLSYTRSFLLAAFSSVYSLTENEDICNL